MNYKKIIVNQVENIYKVEQRVAEGGNYAARPQIMV
jgi:hypothetical protein